MDKLILLSPAIVFFKYLDERYCRLYTGLKAQALGWHGVALVSYAYNIQLCDGGSFNAAADYIVKIDLIKLAKKLKINILAAHYPPYCSK